tara:strand:- start:126 stop:329 length:204 start_codon:yes stop_codon:yes gene_type:complete
LLFIYFELNLLKLISKLIFHEIYSYFKKKSKEFDEIVIANNKDDAIKVALKNNPDSEAINSTWTFKF